MRTYWLVLGMVGSLAIGAAQAAELWTDQAPGQASEARAVAGYAGVGAPRLLLGNDELGGCRLFIYAEGPDEAPTVWFEGTFRSAEGAAQGFVVPFAVSSDPRIGRIEAMSLTERELAITVTHASQGGDLLLTMRFLKGKEGVPASVSYDLPGGTRTCRNLRKLL